MRLTFRQKLYGSHKSRNKSNSRCRKQEISVEVLKESNRTTKKKETSRVYSHGRTRVTESIRRRQGSRASKSHFELGKKKKCVYTRRGREEEREQRHCFPSRGEKAHDFFFFFRLVHRWSSRKVRTGFFFWKDSWGHKCDGKVFFFFYPQKFIELVARGVPIILLRGGEKISRYRVYI